MTNEAVYDARIYPLMAQIIEICKSNGIPMYASFQLEPYSAENSDPLYCSTALLGDNASPRMVTAHNELIASSLS